MSNEIGMDVESLSLYELAGLVRKHWKNVNYAAKPYLEAMYALDDMKDSYGHDDAKSIVTYFLSNAGHWRGEVARMVKKELRRRLDGGEVIPKKAEVKDKPMQPTEDQLEQMFSDSVEGFCTACGEVSHGAENDAVGYTCPCCDSVATFHGPMYFIGLA